ncbi:MAG: mycoredoxin [Ktedonobacterales bacterium]|nr:mycoredoxin [Ktedonobacterales bacterium]
MSQAAPTGIIVYSTRWCGDCRRSKRWLDEHGVAYTNIDIDQDAAAAEYVRSVNDGNQAVPTIVFPDGSILVEPSNTALAAQVEKLSDAQQ